jgi:molybdopterin converting factor small subunit
MKVLFYGKLGSAFGPELEVPVETPCTIARLRRWLAAERPEHAEALQDKRVRAFVGDTMVADTHQVGASDEVEFLAPVSGG